MNCIIVEAISASLILLSAPVSCALSVVKFEAVCSRALEYAPIWARFAESLLIARSTRVIARPAVSRVRTFTRDTPRASHDTDESCTLKSSPLFAPVWNIVPLFLMFSIAV